jgi:hypothetical protein
VCCYILQSCSIIVSCIAVVVRVVRVVGASSHAASLLEQTGFIGFSSGRIPGTVAVETVSSLSLSHTLAPIPTIIDVRVVVVTCRIDGMYCIVLHCSACAQVVDPEMQLAFKKANKKDSTTKLKALSELDRCFANYASNPASDPSTLDSALSLWVCRCRCKCRCRASRRGHSGLMQVINSNCPPMASAYTYSLIPTTN